MTLSNIAFAGLFTPHDLKILALESRIMETFDHPNILKLLGVSFNECKNLFLVMPFMAQGSLLSYLRKKRDEFLVEDEELV